MLLTVASLTVIGAAILAFANGANDVSKGVATLAGSGRASYRAAIIWGTLWTLAGALASLVISAGMVKAFTSAIVGPEILNAPTFALAVALAAAGWVLFASRTGLPVSTTHALTGAIVGVALAAGGSGAIRWPVLLATIAAPLALSPAVSAAIGYGMHALTRRASPACVCVDPALQPASAACAASAVVVPQVVASVAGCDAADGRWRVMPAVAVHWGAGAALSFARGVNDNAKLAAIAALGLSTADGRLAGAFLVTALAMTIGGYIAGLRVARTLGERVVGMDADTGLAAALVAAGLVLAASFYALPVSTTHVATGAIVGAGMRQGSGAVDWARVRLLVAAWIATLPVAAALGGGAAWLLMQGR